MSQFHFSLFLEDLILAFDDKHWGHVAYGAVESNVVIIIDIFGDDTLSILKVNGGIGTERFILDARMKTLDLTVRLGVIG